MPYFNYTFLLSTTTVYNGIWIQYKKEWENWNFLNSYSLFSIVYSFYIPSCKILSLSSEKKLPVPRIDFLLSFPFGELSYQLVYIFESKVGLLNLVAGHFVKIFIFHRTTINRIICSKWNHSILSNNLGLRYHSCFHCRTHPSIKKKLIHKYTYTWFRWMAWVFL